MTETYGTIYVYASSRRKKRVKNLGDIAVPYSASPHLHSWTIDWRKTHHTIPGPWCGKLSRKVPHMGLTKNSTEWELACAQCRSVWSASKPIQCDIPSPFQLWNNVVLSTKARWWARLIVSFGEWTEHLMSAKMVPPPPQDTEPWNCVTGQPCTMDHVKTQQKMWPTRPKVSPQVQCGPLGHWSTHGCRFLHPHEVSKQQQQHHHCLITTETPLVSGASWPDNFLTVLHPKSQQKMKYHGEQKSLRIFHMKNVKPNHLTFVLQCWQCLDSEDLLLTSLTFAKSLPHFHKI